MEIPALVPTLYYPLSTASHSDPLTRGCISCSQKGYFPFPCFHREFCVAADDWEIAFEEIQDLRWLGSGAQGAVFAGTLGSEQVAVKKVKEELETDIRHLRKLNHPNIVQFRGVCVQSPVFCIVMEYCPHGTLFTMLRDGKDVPPRKMVEWTKQIATGMNYLHQHKIIHRDLKSPK